MAESKEKLKSTVMRVKEESEKVGLKLNILKTREESGNSDRCYFLNDSQITVYGDCSHEIKRRLLFGRRALKNLVQFSSVAQPCPTLCDPMNRSTPGLPVHHHLSEFTQSL